MTVFAETERLLLREILPEDEDGLFELDSNPEVHRYLGNKPVKSRDEVRKVIAFIRQQYLDNGIGRWAVLEKETGAFAGWSGLKLVKDEYNGQRDFYEIGYRFCQRFWGQGYATEAGAAALKYGFETMQVPVIYGMAHAENRASRHVLEKLGLQYVNDFTYEEMPKVWYQLRREDYLKRKQ